MKKIKKAAIFLFPFILGGGIGFLGSCFGITLDFFSLFDSILSFLLFFIFSFVLSLVSTILFHEFGHLIAGLLSGYRFLSFRVGNLVLVRYKEGFALKKFSIPGTGGQCLLAPPDKKKGTYPYKLYNNGGWIMNLLMAFGAFLLFKGTDNSYLHFFLGTFIIMQLLAAITNGIPLDLGVPNDGKNIQILNKSREAREGFWDMLKVNELMTKGMRYKDLPEKYLKEPEELNPLTVYYPMYRSMALLEMGEYEKTYTLLKDLMKYPKALTVNEFIVHYDLLSCRILLAEDGGELKSEIDKEFTKGFYKTDKLFKNFLNRSRFWILYYRYVDSNPKKEEEFQKHFEKVSKTHPIRGEVCSEQAILARSFFDPDVFS